MKSVVKSVIALAIMAILITSLCVFAKNIYDKRLEYEKQNATNKLNSGLTIIRIDHAPEERLISEFFMNYSRAFWKVTMSDGSKWQVKQSTKYTPVVGEKLDPLFVDYELK